jgi:hypothetical protein
MQANKGGTACREPLHDDAELTHSSACLIVIPKLNPDIVGLAAR